MRKELFNTLPGEEWKVIDGFPHYRISNLGRVASFVQEPARIRRVTTDKRGYCRVILINSPGKNVTKYVHLLVAAAFLPPLQPGFEVDHINGNASDNRASNLRWCSHKQNIHHAMARRGNWLLRAPKTVRPILRICTLTNEATRFEGHYI